MVRLSRMTITALKLQADIRDVRRARARRGHTRLRALVVGSVVFAVAVLCALLEGP